MQIKASKITTAVLAGLAATAIVAAPSSAGQATLGGDLATYDPICQNPDGSACTVGPGGVTGGIPGGAAGTAGPEGAAGSIPGGPGGAAGPGGPTGTAGPGGVSGCIPGIGCI